MTFLFKLISTEKNYDHETENSSATKRLFDSESDDRQGAVGVGQKRSCSGLEDSNGLEESEVELVRNLLDKSKKRRLVRDVSIASGEPSSDMSSYSTNDFAVECSSARPIFKYRRNIQTYSESKPIKVLFDSSIKLLRPVNDGDWDQLLRCALKLLFHADDKQQLDVNKLFTLSDLVVCCQSLRPEMTHGSDWIKTNIKSLLKNKISHRDDVSQSSDKTFLIEEAGPGLKTGNAYRLTAEGVEQFCGKYYGSYSGFDETKLTNILYPIDPQDCPTSITAAEDQGWDFGKLSSMEGGVRRVMAALRIFFHGNTDNEKWFCLNDLLPIVKNLPPRLNEKKSKLRTYISSMIKSSKTINGERKSHRMRVCDPISDFTDLCVSRPGKPAAKGHVGNTQNYYRLNSRGIAQFCDESDTEVKTLKELEAVFAVIHEFYKTNQPKTQFCLDDIKSFQHRLGDEVDLQTRLQDLVDSTMLSQNGNMYVLSDGLLEQFGGSSV